MPFHTFQLDVSVVAPDREKAQRAMLSNIRSRTGIEPWGIVGIVIHDGAPGGEDQ